MTIDKIKSISLKYGKTYVVKSEGRESKECKLVQQTDFLFVFEPLKVIEEIDKRAVCISKTSWLMDKTLIKEVD